MSLAATVEKAAVRALRSYGAPATLSRATQGDYDPATGASGWVTVSTPCRALLDASSLQGLGFRFGVDLVRAGDLKATLAGATPQQGDRLILPMGTFSIVAVRPTFVGAAAVLHECLVRGAA